MFYLRAEMKYCPILYIYFQYGLKFGAGDVHKNLLSGCEISGNRRIEIYRVLMGVNEHL